MSHPQQSPPKKTTFRLGVCFRRRNVFSLAIAGALLGVLLFSLLLPLQRLRGRKQPEAEDSVERNYKAELPRIAPLSPAEALQSFVTAPGFRIEQVAAEPLVVDPIAMAFDADQRLYVIEMRGYSENEADNLGRVRLLEDRDRDGRYDHSTVFAEGLSWPTAIACYDGGVFVAAAPDMYYFKDTNADGRADIKKLVFTGFGSGNVQGLVNTFKWGLDNRIHGATSSSGAQLVNKQRPESAVLSLRGRDFSWDPRSGDVRAESGGGQHGLSFNRWGDKFVCSNSDHLQTVMFEDRYVARNPYLAPPSPRMSIAADGPQADVFRVSPVEPWRIVRTRLRIKKIVPGPVEGGGRAAGYFTGATGVTIYRGDAWPLKYQDWAIVGDVGSNLIHRKRIDRHGLIMRGVRVDEKSEFAASKDIWFRPVQFANAPDGTLFVADMYREVIEHPKSLAPVLKKHIDLTSGRDRGRIYRIAPEGFQQPPYRKLSQTSSRELVALLDQPNGWLRETAARLLFERQDRQVLDDLETLATNAAFPEGRIRALYALDGLQALTAANIAAALKDKNAQVRRHAVRLSPRAAGDASVLLDQLLALGNDPDVVVCYELGFALGEFSGPRRTRALANLAKRFPHNTWMRLAIRSSLGHGAGDMLQLLAGDANFMKQEGSKAWIKVLSARIGKQQRSDDIAAVLALLRELTARKQDRQSRQTLQLVASNLAAKPGSGLASRVNAATGGKADELLRTLLAQAEKTAANGKLPLSDRVAAVHLLQTGSPKRALALAEELLAPAEPQEIQAAAVALLGKLKDPRVGKLILAAWPGLTPSLRRQSGEVLFSRDIWLGDLLTALQAKQVPISDIDPGRLRALAEHRAADIRQQAKGVIAMLGIGRRGDVLRAYAGVLKMQGDAARGKITFGKVCAACHRIEGVGHEIGPNLAAMRNRGAEAVLSNMLDPNREANPQYLSYNVVTTDGRVLTGMISAETANSITLRRAENAQDVVLRIDIEEMRSSGVSLMPEGLEKQVKPQDAADLIAYLQSLK